MRPRRPGQPEPAPDQRADLARHRAACAKRWSPRTASTIGRTDELLVGLQLTHSGPVRRPERQDAAGAADPLPSPDARPQVRLARTTPVLTDGEIRPADRRLRPGRAAGRSEAGFDFVDVKHCHGYLGHEFLSRRRSARAATAAASRTAPASSARSSQGIRVDAPGLEIGVPPRRSTWSPTAPTPLEVCRGSLARGIPEDFSDALPYRYGFVLWKPSGPAEAAIAFNTFGIEYEDIRASPIRHGVAEHRLPSTFRVIAPNTGDCGRRRGT